MRLMNASMENDLGRNLADFALQWCQFITEVCDEGQGCRPRWANDGINYLVQVADPKVTAHLTDQEFEVSDYYLFSFIILMWLFISGAEESHAQVLESRYRF